MSKTGKNRWICRLSACFLAVLLLTSAVSCAPEEQNPASGSETSEASKQSASHPEGEKSPGKDGEQTSKRDPAEKDPAEKDPQKPPAKEESSITETPTAKDFVIAENGKAVAKIVIPKNPSEKVRLAAEDLQVHLKKITGATVKIGFDSTDRTEGNYILVGPTKYTQKAGVKPPKGYPNAERVILRRKDNYLVLVGNDDGSYQGTQFAVNMFLEKLGCGWFGPDPLWQITPSKKTLAVRELNIDHRPQFDTRLSGVWFNYRKFSQRWYMGGTDRKVGHGISGLIPREEYFGKHPEWFAEVSGVRDPYRPQYWQYCYSNKELAKETARKIIAFFDAHPTVMNYPIGANDGWEEDWCECEACTALGSDTDEILTFANNVAAEVCKKYPDRTLTVLSYHSTYFPPKKVKAHKNVDVMFCLETSMLLPLDAGLSIPTGFNWITHNTYTQSWKGNFQAYNQKAGLQHQSIWAWYCIAADKASWQYAPWVQGNVATDNQKLWKKNGVDFVYYDSGPSANYRENEASFALRWPLWYVAAKGMWDASLSGEDILKDACEKLYGPAADEMFRYYQALADSSALCRSSNTITWVPPELHEVYTPVRVKEIDRAAEKVRSRMGSLTPDQKKRVENQLNYWNGVKAQL